MASLVDHYARIADERMRGLPFVNPRLHVEAVEFRELDEHLFGVLVSPWFMNMIVLPGDDGWADLAQGDRTMVALPAGDYEFTVCRDDDLQGEYLSAVLFRTVADFPDQATAREIADDIVVRLFTVPDAESSGDTDDDDRPRSLSRRSLLSGGSTG